MYIRAYFSSGFRRANYHEIHEEQKRAILEYESANALVSKLFASKLKEEGIGEDLLDLQQTHYIVDPLFFDRTFTRMEDESENEIMTGRMKNSDGHSVAFNINFKSLWRAKLKAAVRLLRFKRGTSISTTTSVSATANARRRHSSLGTRQRRNYEDDSYDEEDSSYLEEASYEDESTFDTYDGEENDDETDDDDDVGQGEITPPSEFSPTHLITPDTRKRRNKTRRTRRNKRYEEVDLNTPISDEAYVKKKRTRRRRRRGNRRDFNFEDSHTDSSILPQGCICREAPCVLL